MEEKKCSVFKLLNAVSVHEMLPWTSKPIFIVVKKVVKFQFFEIGNE